MPRPRRKVKRRSRSRSSMRLDLKSSTRSAISGIVQVGIGVLLFLAIQNRAGRVGDSLNEFLTFFFGSWGVIFPVFLVLSGIVHWISPDRRIEAKRSLGLLLCLISFLGLMHVGAPLEEIGQNRNELAGAIGFLMSVPFVLFLSKAVGYVVLSCMLAIGLLIAFEPDIGKYRSFMRSVVRSFKPQKHRVVSVADDEDEWEETADEDAADLVENDGDAPELNIVRPVFAQRIVEKEAEKTIRKEAKKEETLEMKDTRYEEWTFPSFDLLENAQTHLTVNDEELKQQARMIEEKLKEFDIDVTMKDARPGPTVTQFTLQPAEGVRLSQIANLKDDLALALSAQSLRIEAPIPGKALVGIEMPNSVRTTVHLREILESPSFAQSESPLTLPLGRDVSGDAITATLDSMPHLLIAGATGSGKSVCMNTFLGALLFQNAPHELKFILIDPKRVELMPYDGIPHLLTPVITEAERALQALRWAVAEMGRRLHRLSEQGVRNIDEFNEKQTEEASALPRIVIVIDELADLMMRQFRRDTETMIARIAQLARAVGMYLIIATQRPSVDVITGLIKANIPTRIAFRVVSSVDSRTIIDSIGAEDLLGRGDMLYMNALTPKPIRIQGIYISTKESERVINAVKIAGGGRLTEQIGLGEEEEAGTENQDSVHGHIDLDADDNGGDDLFFEALRVVQASGKASASLLQRQLKVGYARAARLLDIMEEKGLIGPSDGAKARKVYVEKTAA
ncbi:MAG: DNA translocase FtsK 4TM domain-containing protein [Candidatus Peregrinibacteria bacterium]|nr:DNA translocase FtsK 4TM domain-containing protein [Candidatus Peregrinibacteria bacterium]